MGTLLVAATASGASTSGEKHSKERFTAGILTNHVIAADRDGLAIHPVTNERFTNGFAYSNYVEKILRNAEDFFGDPARKTSDPVTVRLLVHVHGGLNDEKDTFERVVRNVPLMTNEAPADLFYPIFFRWPSSLGDTYAEHLLRIRQGRKNQSHFLDTITVPYILVSDVAQAFGKMPITWYYQSVNFKDRYSSGHAWTRGWLQSPQWGAADNKAALRTNPPPTLRFEPEQVVHIARGEFYFSGWERYLKIPLWFVQTPVRMTAGTIGQTSIAEQSWKNMRRRTEQILAPATLYGENVDTDLVNACAAGNFFHILNERIKQRNTNEIRYELTFIGHSMGAIVLNNLLTRYHSEYVEINSLKNIVYMGAACSVNNAVNAIRPLLNEYNPDDPEEDDKRPLLRFYNLTLNRVAEIAETEALGFAPAGSLLEYIDQHLQSPESALDRTMGSEVNILSAIEVFDKRQNFVTYKSFDRNWGRIPMKHGDFSLCPFWKQAFWSSETTTLTNKQIVLNNYGKDWYSRDVAYRRLEPTTKFQIQNQTKPPTGKE